MNIGPRHCSTPRAPPCTFRLLGVAAGSGAEIIGSKTRRRFTPRRGDATPLFESRGCGGVMRMSVADPFSDPDSGSPHRGPISFPLPQVGSSALVPCTTPQARRDVPPRLLPLPSPSLPPHRHPPSYRAHPLHVSTDPSRRCPSVPARPPDVLAYLSTHPPVHPPSRPRRTVRTSYAGRFDTPFSVRAGVRCDPCLRARGLARTRDRDASSEVEKNGTVLSLCGFGCRVLRGVEGDAWMFVCHC